MEKQVDWKQALRELSDAGWAMRNTAVIDDDFPRVRDRFDFLLGFSMGLLRNPEPPKPTYYVLHPDGTFTVADPQP